MCSGETNASKSKRARRASGAEEDEEVEEEAAEKREDMPIFRLKSRSYESVSRGLEKGAA